MKKIIKVPEYKRYTDPNINTNNYFQFKLANGAVQVSDSDINKYIDDLIMDLEKDKTREFSFISTGDTLMTIFRNDEEYLISVCHDYTEITARGI